MADIRYNISQLFQAAFGINFPIYITSPLIKEAPAHISYEGLETLPDYYAPDAQSWMGTPIMFSAGLVSGKYQKYNLNGELLLNDMPDMKFPPATMFQFRRSKNITRTNLLGNNGTVKEIFGFDDWIIDVRGLCLDEPNRSAQEQLSELLKWEQIADSISVKGSQFAVRDIARVCISEFSDNIPQGQPGVVAFQMQLYSDQPVELISESWF